MHGHDTLIDGQETGFEKDNISIWNGLALGDVDLSDSNMVLGNGRYQP